MSRPKEAARIYNINDPEMVHQSGVYKTLFEEDVQLFIDFDTAFSPPFADNWQSAIAAAGAVNQDTTLVDQLAGLTTLVDDKYSLAKNHYQTMKYYIEKAFPNNPAVQNEFGFNDYEEARRTPERMVSFLGSLHTAAAKYTAQLVEAGYANRKINDIPVIKTDLDNACHNRDVFKRTRMLETQTRINTLNECWRFVQQVCKAGKIIFQNDYAKYSRYIIEGETTEPDEEPDTPPENPPANPPEGN